MKHFGLILFLFLITIPSALAQRRMELPEIRRGEIIVHHTGHTLSYDPDAMLPRWVAYVLHAGDMEGDAQRENGFSPDPSPVLESYKLAEHWHYTYSGWVRGHMVPAGDLKYSQAAMSESFYTTNVCPMDMTFNNGIWKRLEEKSRKLAIEFDYIFIVTGPIIGSNKNGKVGESDIVIPDAFYKALLVPYEESYLAIGFIMENEPAPQGSKLRDYAVTIKQLESITGRDFFPTLARKLAAKIENELPLKELGLY